ncbi:hypothetical protein PITC_019600 [Penicillium italicum]|uniref:Uncharacterized protein n=1 Tax=Penicillium italicum TaxID=40296 RepID=A0A0A2L2X1_PENIT|nr:hypothetical protein PITC_019600 [Penicillium italicum]
MDRVNECQHPQTPSFAQLGKLAKLPLEIRFFIWESLFYGIYTAPNALSILRCNRYLYQEISDHLYNGMRHEIRISGADGNLKWLYVCLVSKRMPAKWRGLKNINAVRRHLHNFPHKRIEGSEIFVNITLSSHENFNQIMQLEQKAARLVDILEVAPVTPAVCVSLLEEKPPKNISYTSELPSDYMFATIPFMRLPSWHCRVSLSLFGVVTNEREPTGQSLLGKPTKDGALNDKHCVAN